MIKRERGTFRSRLTPCLEGFGMRAGQLTTGKVHTLPTQSTSLAQLTEAWFMRCYVSKNIQKAFLQNRNQNCKSVQATLFSPMLPARSLLLTPPDGIILDIQQGIWDSLTMITVVSDSGNWKESCAVPLQC